MGSQYFAPIEGDGSYMVSQINEEHILIYLALYFHGLTQQKSYQSQQI